MKAFSVIKIPRFYHILVSPALRPSQLQSSTKNQFLSVDDVFITPPSLQLTNNSPDKQHHRELANVSTAATGPQPISDGNHTKLSNISTKLRVK